MKIIVPLASVVFAGLIVLALLSLTGCAAHTAGDDREFWDSISQNAGG